MDNKVTDNVKIMTLNVNGFRGCTKEQSVSNEICMENMKQIKDLIDNVICNKNDIIVLQEIPHKIKIGKGCWRYNPLFNSFEEMFKGYKISKPKHLIDSLQCTVAICKKESLWKELPEDVLQYDEKYSYGNKFVELQCESIILLGVHMPTNNETWDLLIQTLSDTPYTYVVGDFNANERRGTMANKPKELRKCGYNSLIANNIITCYLYKTSIDNIFIMSDYIVNKNVSIKIVNTNLTDHALCMMEHEDKLF